MLHSGEQQQSTTDAYTSLCRVIEVTRICVFDTLTQYRALFSDEDAGGAKVQQNPMSANISLESSLCSFRLLRWHFTSLSSPASRGLQAHFFFLALPKALCFSAGGHGKASECNLKRPDDRQSTTSYADFFLPLDGRDGGAVCGFAAGPSDVFWPKLRKSWFRLQVCDVYLL